MESALLMFQILACSCNKLPSMLRFRVPYSGRLGVLITTVLSGFNGLGAFFATLRPLKMRNAEEFAWGVYLNKLVAGEILET